MLPRKLDDPVTSSSTLFTKTRKKEKILKKNKRRIKRIHMQARTWNEEQKKKKKKTEIKRNK